MGKATHVFCCGQYRDQSKQPALKQTKKEDNQTQTRLVQDVSHGQKRTADVTVLTGLRTGIPAKRRDSRRAFAFFVLRFGGASRILNPRLESRQKCRKVRLSTLTNTQHDACRPIELDRLYRT